MRQISSIVREVVSRNPLIANAMTSGILNYSAATRLIKPDVESVLGRRAKPSAILAAMKRMERDEQDGLMRLSRLELEKVMQKSGLVYISVRKNEETLEAVEAVRKGTAPQYGETFVETVGNYEINILCEEGASRGILSRLGQDEVLAHIGDVCQLSVFHSKNMINVPGMYAIVTRQLAAHGVNLLDCFSTFTEFSFIVDKGQAQTAFKALTDLLEDLKKRKKVRNGRA